VRRFHVPVIAVAGIALITAGCGSSATNDYRGQVKSIQQKYDGRLQTLTGRVSAELGTNSKAASADLGQLAATVTSFADAVAVVKAPTDKQVLAAKLVGAYRLLAKASLDLKSAVDANSPSQLPAVMNEFNGAVTQESSTVDALNAAG
jgi:hypothetical protein